MAEIINGKLVSAEVRKSIKEEVESFKAETGITPGLAVILVGNDPASAVYVIYSVISLVVPFAYVAVTIMPAGSKDSPSL